MDLKLLKLLSKDFPTAQAVSAEIINLNGICRLPKGTEHFMSDLHGEDRAFRHIMNNCSGALREKIDRTFSNSITKTEKNELAKLIYYPEERLVRIKAKLDVDSMHDWYAVMLTRLIEVCRAVTHKYTRSKVRKALPKDFAYAIDELLHRGRNEEDRVNYYKSFIDSIIKLDCADEFIVSLANVIKRMTVDTLHIVGDIYDRGPHADSIVKQLMQHHDVDIQWGNHDVLWMGAASGSRACIATVVKNCLQYDNLDMLENSYGITLLPLSIFAQEQYGDNDASVFTPRVKPIHGYEPKEAAMYARMHKAICVIMFKLEGQLVKRNPDFDMMERNVLGRINYDDMTYEVNGVIYELRDKDFPTVDPKDPCKLTEQEEYLMQTLLQEFVESEKLQRHIRFLYDVGAVYKVCNNNLLYHGCMPTNEDGSFMAFKYGDKEYSGKALFDYADKMARIAFFKSGTPEEIRFSLDYMWFLWCGKHSPIFGKQSITTFERALIEDKTAHNEPKNPYYKWYDSVEFCEKILREFGIEHDFSHIINGHMPVKVKRGEDPRHANGKLIVIDGGFCKAYQSTTGIAGYTMYYTSTSLRIYAHEPYTASTDEEMLDADINSKCVQVDYAPDRVTVGDTDIGKALQEQIEALEDLLFAYRNGLIKEGRR